KQRSSASERPAWPPRAAWKCSARGLARRSWRVAESRRHFRARVDDALENPRLQQALTEAMTSLRAVRERGFQSYDFETGREELKRRRRETLPRLPELVEQFRQRIEAVGGQFHFARDATEARQIVGQICERAGAGIVTKSKSMATEEIGL